MVNPGRQQPAPALMDGGPQPAISPAAPSSMSITTGYGAGTIVIDTSARRLYLMQSQNTALVYPISVGRVGFTWTGTQSISRVASWPDWHPPAEMRARQPGLPEKMTGGVRNPLGAKALYLGNSLYRIHGTNNAQSIGQANSSGCFRLTNAHVVDLASRVGVGTTVVVKSKI
jgi:lipoprotein-anchoring transpeptidase ErfK/SrfK